MPLAKCELFLEAPERAGLACNGHLRLHPFAAVAAKIDAALNRLAAVSAVLLDPADAH